MGKDWFDHLRSFEYEYRFTEYEYEYEESRAEAGTLHRESMQMAIKQIRLASQAKDQLVRLKSRLAIPQWNILCRWAFCISIAEETPPTPVDIPADSNVEMTWHVFGGEYHEVYFALLRERCVLDGVDIHDDAAVNRQFRLHLHRGIGYMATPNRIRSTADLVGIALEG